MSFICPQCGGKHFGTSANLEKNASGSVTNATITEYQCHDQFQNGCKWRGTYQPDTMTTETNTTDFDTVRAGIHSHSWANNRASAHIALQHSALVAQRDALCSAQEAFIEGARWWENYLTSGDQFSQEDRNKASIEANYRYSSDNDT